MSSTLKSVATQLCDKLVDVLTGPVYGTITATASTGTVSVPIGTIATIGSGSTLRRLRVVERATIYAGTPAPVKARLETLSPSFPAAGNFAAIANGTTATWVSPPANLAATGTTNQFGSGTLAGSVMIGSIVETDLLESPADLFSAGAQGTAALALISPTLRRSGPSGVVTRGLFEATWRLRLALRDIGEQPTRRTRARDAFDAITRSLMDATAGDDIVIVSDWKPIRETGWVGAWEMSIVTMLEVDGRGLNSVAGLPVFGDVDTVIKIPGDASQPTPFRVLVDPSAG